MGLGCHYPGADELPALWENILARRCQFRQMPDERLPLAEYHDSDRNAPDKTYATQAAVIDGFEFDWVKRRVPHSINSCLNRYSSLASLRSCYKSYRKCRLQT